MMGGRYFICSVLLGNFRGCCVNKYPDFYTLFSFYKSNVIRISRLEFGVFFQELENNLSLKSRVYLCLRADL